MSPHSPETSWPARWPWSAGTVPSATGDAAVASTDRYATEAGRDALARGGNAVDAAVAVSFALAVVNPEAGNVGGGGFLLVREPGGAISALDYRSRAPAAATRDMFLDGRGEVGDRSQVGHLAVAVPGSVRGLWDAWDRFGRTPWPDLVQPAVELARGFEVTDRFTRSFPEHIVEGLARFPSSAAIFLPDGRPPELGETFRQADLARTLERIRDEGPDGFYRGAVADAIVAEMERGGGLVTREDLASYRALWREPLRFRYRDREVVSMPPASSGGVTLALICQGLAALAAGHTASNTAGDGWHSADHVHRLVEVWKRAFADRNRYLADPDFADVPVGLLGSPEYGSWRVGDVREGRATPSAEVVPGVERYRAGGSPASPEPEGSGDREGGVGPGHGGSHTTHVSVVDREGMAVSLTTTLNTWYGSKLVAPGTGVLLNNEMDDLSAKPGAPNHFGLVQGELNAVEPGKRPLSAMTPTLVLDAEGALELVVGSPGGGTIITTVFQVLSNVVDHGMALGDAVAAPRVHHQHLPDVVRYEPGGLPPGVVAQLEAMGHRVEVRDEPSGDVQAVRVGSDGVEGVADPRRGGVALAP